VNIVIRVAHGGILPFVWSIGQKEKKRVAESAARRHL